MENPNQPTYHAPSDPWSAMAPFTLLASWTLFFAATGVVMARIEGTLPLAALAFTLYRWITAAPANAGTIAPDRSGSR